jgi:hypothetical protein
LSIKYEQFPVVVAEAIKQNKKVNMNKISSPLHNIDINYKTYRENMPLEIKKKKKQPGVQMQFDVKVAIKKKDDDISCMFNVNNMNKI